MQSTPRPNQTSSTPRGGKLHLVPIKHLLHSEGLSYKLLHLVLFNLFLHPEGADKLAKFFGLTLDELVHLEDASPKDIRIEDKTVNEKVQLIAQLEEEDKFAVYRIIDSMLTRTKFQDFFQKNLPAAK